MPIYIYKALSANGAELTREATAPSLDELRGQLEAQGLLVREVRLKRGALAFWGGQRVRPKDLLQANQEFIVLLQAGMTLPDTVELTADRPESPVLSSVFRQVLADLKEGVSFSEACAKYPRVFDGLYLSSLKTGEKSGNLVQPLSRYQEYLAQKIVLQEKVSQAMVYPIFLLLVLVGVLGLLFTFVLPRFAALYAGFNTALPLPTRILMTIVDHLPWVAAVLGGGGAALWLAFKAWVSTPSGRFTVDNAKQNLLILRDFTRPFLVSQLTRTLSTLLAGGTTLTEALGVAQESIPNVAFARRFQPIVARILEGESLSKALDDAKMLPRTALKLIQVGEASGQLEAMLQEVARSFDRLLESRVQRVLVLIEPLFILLAGVLIGSVILVMYLPILHLSDVVK